MNIFKPEQLFRRLHAGHTLITANSRLARVLADRYDDWRIAGGDRQWPSAAILSWAPLGLGFLWQLWDKDKLAWHDRLSGTRLRHYPKAA